MVNIIENYATVTGKVSEILPNPKMDGYTQIKLALKDSQDVDDFPNLAKADEGTDILINVRNEDLENLHAKEGKKLTGKVSKAAGQVYFLK